MTPPKKIRLDYNVGIGKSVINLHTVDTGVPHAVHFVEEEENYPVKEVGSKIRFHKAFEPDGTNADFVKIRDESTISVRTYERGVENETLACGTGVVASAIISHIVKGTTEPVKAITRSADILMVYFKRQHTQFRDVYLEAKATIVFEGGLHYV